MPKYVIHVGMTKTGSTHLQVSLRDMAPTLLAHGIRYPDNWWTTPKDFHHGALHRALFKPVDDDTRAIFAEFNNADERTVVLSCEGFFGLHRRQLVELRRLLGGHETEIVIYLRRWSDWIPSHWQQVVKAGGTETFPEAFVRLFRDQRARPLNYLTVLDGLANVFGADSLRIVSYSNLMDAKDDLVRQFCDAILGVRDVTVAAEGRTANISTGLHATEMARWLNGWSKARGRPADMRNAQTLLRHWDDPALKADIDAVTQAMDAHRATIHLDDEAINLRAQYDRLMRKYGPRIVNPGTDGALFERRARDASYIRPDYLLDVGMAERIERIATSLVEHAEAAPHGGRLIRAAA